MPDDPVAEGPPAGRSDPGGGLSSKIGPLPLWGWGVVGVGIVGFLLWKHGSSSSTDLTGSASGLPASAGVTTTDPMTMAELLQEMQQLATQIGTLNQSPGTGNSTGSSGTPPPTSASSAGSVPFGTNNQGAIQSAPASVGPRMGVTGTGGAPSAYASSHTSGGSSTARVAQGGFPISGGHSFPWPAVQTLLARASGQRPGR